MPTTDRELAVAVRVERGGERGAHVVGGVPAARGDPTYAVDGHDEAVGHRNASGAQPRERRRLAPGDLGVEGAIVVETDDERRRRSAVITRPCVQPGVAAEPTGVLAS